MADCGNCNDSFLYLLLQYGVSAWCVNRAFEVHKSSLKRKAYILILDVNNFKKINDTFGNTLGDSCLKTIASVIRKV